MDETSYDCGYQDGNDVLFDLAEDEAVLKAVLSDLPTAAAYAAEQYAEGWETSEVPAEFDEAEFMAGWIAAIKDGTGEYLTW